LETNDLGGWKNNRFLFACWKHNKSNWHLIEEIVKVVERFHQRVSKLWMFCITVGRTASMWLVRIQFNSFT